MVYSDVSARDQSQTYAAWGGVLIETLRGLVEFSIIIIVRYQYWQSEMGEVINLVFSIALVGCI